MAWLSAAPGMLLAAALLLVPGVILGWFLSLRGFALVGAAPLFSVSLVAVASTVDPVFGLRWSWWTVAVLTVLASAVAWFLLRRAQGTNGVAADATYAPGQRDYAWRDAGYLALLLSAVIIAVRFTQAVGEPSNISQTFDNVFHLNAIRYIGDTGQASSFTVGQMTGLSFYPAAWHALVALVVPAAGGSIPVAVSATNTMIAALVWPAGCIWLSRQVRGNRQSVSWAAGVLAAAFGAFPLLMIDFGVLYPNLLAISLLPALLALLAQLFHLSRDVVLGRVAALGALVVALPGISLAHPSTTMAAMAFIAPGVALRFIDQWVIWRKDWPQHRATALRLSIVALAGLVVAVVAWWKVRPNPASATWPPVQPLYRSAVQILSSAPLGLAPAYVAAALALLGVVVLFRRRAAWWVLGMGAVGSALFCIVASIHFGRWRSFFTGIWYNDPFRLAALLPTVLIVPAVIGAVWLWDRVIGPRLAGRSRGLLAVSGVAVVVVLCASTQLVGSVPAEVSSAQTNYRLDTSSPLLSSDEDVVLEELDSVVPPGAVIASNPGNGSALAYALADRKTIQLHILTSNLTPDDTMILQHLNQAKTNTAVCAAAQRLTIRYVLDFGTAEVNDGHHPAPGLENLDTAGVGKILLQKGSAKLYELTACRE